MNGDETNDPIIYTAEIRPNGSVWSIRFPFGRIELATGYGRIQAMEMAEVLLRISIERGWGAPGSTSEAA
ncbi:MAG: hypothetical protein KIT79_10045 [Deltaproteobacteria bacterium]|nr:hypothetical protein [Deltaproteobacteria bacterium]